MALSHKELENHGIRLAAISCDTADVLEAFAAENTIPYPLLTDANSDMIRAFGVLNEKTFKPGHAYYGIPYPCVFLVDEDGVVRGKFAKRRYQERPPVAELLRALAVRDSDGNGSESSDGEPAAKGVAGE